MHIAILFIENYSKNIIESEKPRRLKFLFIQFAKRSWKCCLKINKSVRSAAYLSFNSIRFCYLILPLPPLIGHLRPAPLCSARPVVLRSSGFLCLQRISFKYFAFALIWFWAAASCAIATARLSSVIANLKSLKSVLSSNIDWKFNFA